MNAPIAARRDRVARALELRDEILLIGAGDRILVPGTGDQTYPFRSHPEYYYLTDRECPGAVLAFDPAEGWTDFVPDVTERERVWEAGTQAEGSSLALLGAWLAARRGRRVAMLGVELPGQRFDAALSLTTRERLTHARRPKDETELARIRAAAAATAAGYAAVRPLIRPGVTEREIARELEFGFRRAGADGTAYETIVGSGPNAAVLHFMPTERAVGEGEMVLIDAAAGVGRYACDVTRTFPAGAAFTARQRDLHAIVAAMTDRACARCVAGAEMVEIHLAAFREATEGLVALGLARGDVDGLIERGVTELFFPHGIAHMVGLGVRDATGKLPGRTPDARPGRRLQRMDLPLEPGYVLTIEPGIYFIPALLHDPKRREKMGDAVAWSEAERWIGEGGVRVEETVHVTDGAPEVMTAATPR
ncbi:MAG: aminopeptidase P N-terminal domain-containing protein [Hyphomicrobiales bacterium]